MLEGNQKETNNLRIYYENKVTVMQAEINRLTQINGSDVSN